MSERLRASLAGAFYAAIGGFMLAALAIFGINAVIAFLIWSLPPALVMTVMLRIAIVIGLIIGVMNGVRTWWSYHR